MGRNIHLLWGQQTLALSPPTPYCSSPGFPIFMKRATPISSTQPGRGERCRLHCSLPSPNAPLLSPGPGSPPSWASPFYPPLSFQSPHLTSPDMGSLYMATGEACLKHSVSGTLSLTNLLWLPLPTKSSSHSSVLWDLAPLLPQGLRHFAWTSVSLFARWGSLPKRPLFSLSNSEMSSSQLHPP